MGPSVERVLTGVVTAGLAPAAGTAADPAPAPIGASSSTAGSTGVMIPLTSEAAISSRFRCSARRYISPRKRGFSVSLERGLVGIVPPLHEGSSAWKAMRVPGSAGGCQADLKVRPAVSFRRSGLRLAADVFVSVVLTDVLENFAAVDPG